MKATIIHAPHSYGHIEGPKPIVFLAGSIEMGKAVDWQASVIAALADIDCLILNPRRPDWDASWVQSIDNPQFNEQVTWELDSMENADVIAFYFAPGTMSPISLLEFGMHAPKARYGDKRIIACCPEGFWRKGNVDIVAARYGVESCANIAMFTRAIADILPTISLI